MACNVSVVYEDSLCCVIADGETPIVYPKVEKKRL
jgi:hypothetical protein